jgi:hypothetical protein
MTPVAVAGARRSRGNRVALLHIVEHHERLTTATASECRGRAGIARPKNAFAASTDCHSDGP